ncbi:MAG: TIR domain-containing protein [Rhodomicrobium sp.]
MLGVVNETSGPAKPGSSIGDRHRTGQSQPASERLRVFISYSRDDLNFADQLDAALGLCGFSCSLDRHGISGGEEWKQRLGNLIAEADTVVFVLSPSSASSHVCTWEVEEAERNGKRIIPAVCRPLEEASPPPRLKELNYIYFYPEPKVPGSGFGCGLASLVPALNTDLEWLREHTRYQQRALEWEEGSRPAIRLLSGSDIAEAKAWAARRPKAAPALTPLQLGFIRASEDEQAARENAQQRQLAEREEALRQAQESLRKAQEAQQQAAEAQRRMAEAQRKRARLRNIMFVVVSLAAVVAGWEGWNATSERDKGRKVTAATTKLIFSLSGRYKFDERAWISVRDVLEKGVAQGDTVSMTNVGWLYAHGKGVTQDYAMARKWYEQAAGKGEAGAMYNLGWLYENGQGVLRDFAMAFKWYERAAGKGEAGAMTSLGWLYENGQSVGQDYAKAREWYEKAADKGEAGAMTNLGSLYEDGQGVGQDYAKAREWYEKAATKGDAAAMYNLGLLYAFGKGVPRDYAKVREWNEKAAGAGEAGATQNDAEAHLWHEKAASKGSARAMNILGWLYENGIGVKQDYAKAVEWYGKAAGSGDTGAMANLGVLYENGQGVGQDYAKARELYDKAAAKGYASAMTSLGELYKNGRAVPQDYAKAVEWYEKAAAKGDTDAMIDLGLLYANGEGVPQNGAKAIEWLGKAGGKGDADAMTGLGRRYENGRGVKQDYAKAREWYEKAAAVGDAGAMSNLGWLYYNGEGVKQDYARAREWYGKAAAKGDDGAKDVLVRLAIDEAASAGRYAEALTLSEARARTIEAAEVKRDAKPGQQTERALLSVSWFALFARDFAKSLVASERGHGLDPDDLTIETNHAHALMFLGRSGEAKAIYLANKGVTGHKLGEGKTWNGVVAEDFAELRKAGLSDPLMGDIEKELGISG